eukprot:3555511-Pyramimonas_sp.AAC.1
MPQPRLAFPWLSDAGSQIEGPFYPLPPPRGLAIILSRRACRVNACGLGHGSALCDDIGNASIAV